LQCERKGGNEDEHRDEEDTQKRAPEDAHKTEDILDRSVLPGEIPKRYPLSPPYYAESLSSLFVKRD